MITIGVVNVWFAVAIVVIVQIVKESLGRADVRLPSWTWLLIATIAAIGASFITTAQPLSIAVVGEALVYIALVMLGHRIGIKGLETLIQKALPGFTWTHGKEP